jgi:hypothetical protein
MNIAQLSEQLKDVPQAKLIDYAKNPNSVVPQFLALAEIQRRQTLMRAMPAQEAQSSVAEDIMAQEAPRMSGVAQLPTRAMFTEQGMAGGGIVAFADGGDAEEEYEEALEKSKRSRMQGLQEALAEAGTYFKNPLAKAEAKPTRAERLASEEMQMNAPAPVQRKGSHKYEDLVLAEAQRQGIDPSLARHVLYKETGNLSNPETAKSKAGAIGIMQLMPKTAKELGVDPTNPEENIRGGVMYLRKMMDKYNDPVLAAAAYNAGPGRVDKALKGEGLTALPRETRMYIAGLAEGGEVKRYQVGGELEADPYGMSDIALEQELEKRKERARLEEEQRKEFLRTAAPELLTKPTKPPVEKAKPTTAIPKQSDQAEVRKVDDEITRKQFSYPPQGGIGPTAAELGIGAQEAPKGPTSQSYFDALMKNIEAQAEDAKRQGDQNKYLALMQAGFGMMASTSPYAGVGIGQGAMTGVGTYAGLEKGRREQERGILAAQLGLGKAKASQEEAEALRLATERYREATGARLGEEARTKETALFRDDLRQYEQMRIKQIENKYKNNPLFGTDPKLQDQYNREIAAIQNDPQYLALVKRAYPNIQLPTSPSGAPGGARKTLSTFGS